MKIKGRHITLLLSLCCTLGISAQIELQQDRMPAQSTLAPFVWFDNITTEDGLSHSRVRSFSQDSRGFIWIGTVAGLNRFDGYNFTLYKKQAGNKNTLGHNMVTSLLEDSNGNFWIGTKAGLQLMNHEKNLFFPDPASPENPLKSIGHVLVILGESGGDIWIGATTGLYRLSTNGHRIVSTHQLEEAIKKQHIKLTHFRHQAENANGLNHNRVWSLAEDPEGYLWIGTEKGLNRFNLKENTFDKWSFGNTQSDEQLRTTSIHALCTSQSGHLWVGTDHGLFRRTKGLKTVELFTTSSRGDQRLSNNSITEIVEGKNGGIWIGSDGGGLDYWDPSSKKMLHYPSQLNISGRIGDNNVEALYRDANGGLWVGTHKGVSYLNPYRKPFRLYQSDGSQQSIPPGTVTSIFERPNGEVWIGIDDGGVSLFDPENETFKHYRHQPGNPQSICDNDVVSILEDRFGAVWMGSWGAGITKLIPAKNGNRTNDSFNHYTPDAKTENSISDRYIWTFYEDRQGELWVGTVNKGLCRYDRASDSFQSFIHDANNSSSLPQNWVQGICEDQSGSLWVATSGHISQLVKASGEFVNYPVQLKDNLNASSICVHPTDDGNLWLGTDIGLVHFNPARQTFKHWDESDGLPDNFVISILEDNHGNLWLTTGKGISKFNIEKTSFRNFDPDDSYQLGEFSPARLKSSKGEFYFGGVSGFNVFHPDSIQDNPIAPQIAITDFKLLNQSVPIRGSTADTLNAPSPLQQNIIYCDEIELSHWQNNFSFEFAALSYLNPDKNTYQFKLEGYQDEWLETGADQRFAHYTNLPPGEYTFRARGANNDGYWNETGDEVNIIIHSPWWATWWAYLIYSLGLGALIYFFRSYELNRQQLKHDLELEQIEAEKFKELNSLKSRLYTNITHEFRTPLTVISGMADMIQKPEKSKELIQRHSNGLLQLVNQMLDLAKLEAGNLRLELIQADVVPYLENLTNSFQSLALRKRINLVFYKEEDEYFMDFDEHKLHSIVSNLLSNAIKFTPEGGKVILHLREEKEGRLLLKVKDTGVGIPPHKLPHIFERFYQVDDSTTRRGEGTGIGLALTKELVQLMQGDIEVKSKLGSGSEFKVSIPVSRQAPFRSSMHYTPKLSPILPQPEIPKPSGGEEAIPKDSNLPQLLLVEDNPDIATYLKFCLESHYIVNWVENGALGIEWAFEHIPDVIISDVMMPEKDGFEVCQTLKNDERTSHIPIVLLTARADAASRLEGIGLGADAYLSKPFLQEELMIRLEKLLELRRNLQERYANNKASQSRSGDNKEEPNLEDRFLQKVITIISENLNDADFGKVQLASKMRLSESQLFRKLKALTGKSTALYIRSIRLKKGKEMLQSSELTVAEVAYAVGFSDPAYFSRTFSKEFGEPPNAIRK